MMKSSRLILLGVLLLLAGVIGFASSYSRAQEQAKENAGQAGGTLQLSGFLPMAIPRNHQAGAPTLPASETSALSETGQLSTGTGSPVSASETPTSSDVLSPDRIVIPKIELDAPVIAAKEESIEIEGIEYLQYLAPDEFAAGWHTNSAPLGRAGNTVLNGHHNVFGKVFGRLVELTPGDRILVYSGKNIFEFQVANVLILKERDAEISTRLENARWIEPSQDTRLTLVTCWPDYSNTHRLIIVASPVAQSSGDDGLQ